MLTRFTLSLKSILLLYTYLLESLFKTDIAVYNCEYKVMLLEFLSKSIRLQLFCNFDYVVVDGGNLLDFQLLQQFERLYRKDQTKNMDFDAHLIPSLIGIYSRIIQFSKNRTILYRVYKKLKKFELCRCIYGFISFFHICK